MPPHLTSFLVRGQDPETATKKVSHMKARQSFLPHKPQSSDLLVGVSKAVILQQMGEQRSEIPFVILCY